ncbi:MAG: hypothetical protein CSYNP_01609 [Syntrophus sp. SKADARSKE-3]|nr:hypothetical protein [Syntrophus sp. SKADARSKE-3]
MKAHGCMTLGFFYVVPQVLTGIMFQKRLAGGASPGSPEGRGLTN